MSAARNFLLVALVSISGFLLRPVFAAPLEYSGTVLVLHSYHQGYSWTDGQQEGIAKELGLAAPNVQLAVYYLDWKRNPDPAALDHIENLIRFRHAADNVRAIVTTDDAALLFAMRLRRSLWSRVPVIHGGVVEGTLPALIADERLVTGVPEPRDFAGSARMAMAANPNFRRIYFLRDRTETGLGLEAAMHDALTEANIDLERHVLGDEPFDTLLDRVSRLPKDSFILFGVYSTDDRGRTLPMERYLEMLAARTSVPIFGLHELLLGRGLAGGSLLSATEHGRAVGAMTSSVLDGVGMEKLTVGPDRSIVRGLDYQQMERFGLAVDRVPDVELIVNKPFSFMEAYRTLVVAIEAVILGLTAIVIALTALIRQRSRAEAALQKTNLALSASRLDLERNVAELTTSREKLAASEQQLRLVAEASRDIIWNWDVPCDKRTVSGRVYQLLGCSASALNSYESWRQLIHPEDREGAEELLRRHLAGETPEYRAEYRVRREDGTYIWIFATGKALFGDDGKPTLMAGSYTDITAERSRQERLDRLAHYDPLTGLPNRVRLAEHVDELIEADKAAGRGQPLGLLFLDMDNFKIINDSFGHRTGDDLLIEFGHRIQHHAGNGLFVSRLGGDEFVVVVHGTAAGDVSEVAARLENCLKTAFLIAGQNFYVSCSVGIARYPWDGRDFDELLQNADTAMYWAKESGRGRVCTFKTEMNRNVVDRVRLLSRARQALDTESFTLNFQPKVATSDGKVQGFEALVRWTDPELGVVSPARFIPVCEDSGLILPLGSWILQKACAEAVALNARNQLDLTMSVNVSVVQLTQPDFVRQVLQVLEETGLIPELLELEITESRVIGSFEETTKKLHDLRNAGVRIALDDFGTGYSSLTYLRQLPIHTLKLDKSFIDDVQHRSDARNLVSSIARIARDLSHAVVAEGVEEMEQWETLARIGCDIIQGYVVSRPLPAGQIDRFLSEWEERRRQIPRSVARPELVVGIAGRS